MNTVHVSGVTPEQTLDARASLSRAHLCLVLLALCGLSVILVDGLHRDYRFDDVTIESLTYEPQPVALVLAAVTLPLCFAFATAARLTARFALLFWFVLGTSALAKDFAYLRIPGAPVFVTEATLAVLLCLEGKETIYSWRRLPWAVSLLLGSFLLLGFVSFLRGLAGGHSSLLAARDSALVLYVLFLPIGCSLAKNGTAIRPLLTFFLLGTLLSALHSVLFFLRFPGERRYIAYGLYVVIALVGLLVSRLQRRGQFPGSALCLLLLAAGALLANARSLYVAMLAGLLFAGILSARSLRETLVLHAKFLGVAIALALVVLSVSARPNTLGEFTDRLATEFVSGTVRYEEDDNAEFRLLAWAEAYSRFEANPLFGEGFGVPFSFERSEFDLRPHNTYLTVLYKMGLAGLLSLLGALACLYWRAWKALRHAPGGPEGTMLPRLLVAQVVMATYALVNLFLESPFFASIFWLAVGMTAGLASLQPVFACHSERSEESLPEKKFTQRGIFISL